MAQPTYEEFEQAVDVLLRSVHWPVELKTNELYSVHEDDGESDDERKLGIMVVSTGDVFVSAFPHPEFLRFRYPQGGGGASSRVRNALLLLAIAIKRDGEDHKKNEQFQS